MNKKDMFIKQKLQQDKEISDRANKIFENLKEEFIMDNNEKKVIKISFNKFLAIAASFVLVLFVGTNLYAHSLGKPNIFTAIKNLFNVDKEDYNAAEEDINITVESNGVKLTLKTAAMDDNVLIVKYVAEGEKLAEELYTYQDFETELVKINQIKFKLVGTDIGTDEYDSYTLKDVTKMTQAMVDKLKELGLTDEDARELEELGLDAYNEYVGAKLAISEYYEEEAKTQVEKTIAMFESKVTSKYKIIASEDKLSEYSIDAIAQSIEKEENQYIIHAIYNVDTLVDILEKFDLNLNINKIGTIEGKWNYSVELNKAKLNKRVETIEFYNQYDVVVDTDKNGGAENDIRVVVNQLSISDFSSVLNIKTIVEEHYFAMDYDNLHNNIVPLTFVVSNKEGKVIGTSHAGGKTELDGVYNTTIVDRIILKDVDYNTEKITIKMYSNNYNSLIKTLEINLKEANNLMDTNLEDTFYSEIAGILFRHPKDWTEFFIPDAGSYRLQSPENLDGNRAYLNINAYGPININGLSVEEMMKNIMENKGAKIEAKGKITVGTAKIDGDYFIDTFDEEKWKTVVIFVDDAEYEISFGGDAKLYTKYYTVFEKMLETMSFSKCGLWEDLETEQNNTSNEEENNSNINSVENIIDSNINEKNDNNLSNVNFTDKEIEQILINYLNIFKAYGSPEGLLVSLGLLEFGEYSNSELTENNYRKTNIKYAEFKEKALNYISENWFNTIIYNARFSIKEFEEKDELLYYFDGGWTGTEYEVESITLKGAYSNSTYIAKVYRINPDESKTNENIEFTVEDYNGKCVISYCD